MMQFTNMKYADASHTVVVGFLNGNSIGLSAETGNRHWNEIIKQGILVADYAEPVETTNAPILTQIEAKEKEALRSLRELMREQHFPGDLAPQAKAFAQNKVRQLDQDIETLRGQLV